MTTPEPRNDPSSTVQTAPGAQPDSGPMITASTVSGSHVHLVDARLVRRTLCNTEIARLCPPGHLWSQPCPECIGRALAAGITVAQERNTVINLQRVPCTWS